MRHKHCFRCWFQKNEPMIYVVLFALIWYAMFIITWHIKPPQ